MVALATSSIGSNARRQLPSLRESSGSVVSLVVASTSGVITGTLVSAPSTLARMSLACSLSSGVAAAAAAAARSALASRRRSRRARPRREQRRTPRPKRRRSIHASRHTTSKAIAKRPIARAVSPMALCMAPSTVKVSPRATSARRRRKIDRISSKTPPAISSRTRRTGAPVPSQAGTIESEMARGSPVASTMERLNLTSPGRPRGEWDWVNSRQTRTGPRSITRATCLIRCHAAVKPRERSPLTVIPVPEAEANAMLSGRLTLQEVKAAWALGRAGASMAVGLIPVDQSPSSGRFSA